MWLTLFTYCSFFLPFLFFLLFSLYIYRLSLNLQFFCLTFLSARIAGMYHYVLLIIFSMVQLCNISCHIIPIGHCVCLFPLRYCVYVCLCWRLNVGLCTYMFLLYHWVMPLAFKHLLICYYPFVNIWEKCLLRSFVILF